VTVHDRQRGETYCADLEEGSTVLSGFESQGQSLPFSCRQGCCTACAVRVLEGELDQRDALGLSQELRQRGYGLLCVARVTAPLTVETQDEDEVYLLQFGNAFAKGRIRSGLPFDED
jgi:ferredoxin